LNFTPFTAEDVRAMIFELARGEHESQFTLDNDKNVIIHNNIEYKPAEIYKLLASAKNFNDFLLSLYD